MIIKATIGYNAMSGCDELKGTGGVGWDLLIPAKTDIQTPTFWEGGSLWYNTADVYKSTSGNLGPGSNAASSSESYDPKDRIGYWVDIEVPFMYQRMGYQNAQEKTLLTATVPWGFYWGYKYIVERCDGAGAPYEVIEDYWNEPWFSWNSVKLYDIVNKDTGALVAKIKGEAIPRIGTTTNYAGWQADVTTPNGTAIATLQQQWTSWTANAKWHVENLRPDLVPNTVINFIGMVLDVQQNQESDNS
jgi:hypothetical protein